MAVNPTVFAMGILPNTGTNIVYTAPAGTQAITKSIIIHNTDTSDITVTFFIRVSGTNHALFSQIIPGEATLFFNEIITIDANDSFVIQSTASNVANYMISGAEKT